MGMLHGNSLDEQQEPSGIALDVYCRVLGLAPG